MVSAVLSLPQVLYEAQRHSVDEIAIERAEPVTFHGEQGALILGEPLDDSDISDALSQVLAPEQQAELAVAGKVEFFVEGYSQWTLLAETAEDGVVIRGRIRDGQPAREVGVPLDLPPLQPFEPDAGTDIPQSEGSVLQQSGNRSTRWDVGLASSMLESSASPSAEAPPLPPSPSRMFDDDDGADFALVGRTGPTGDLPSAQTGAPSAEVGPTGHIPLMVAGATGGQEPLEPADPTVDPAMDTTLPQVQATRGTRPTMHGGDTLAAHVDALESGGVVYLAGRGVGERLLEHLDEGYETIDDDSWATVTTLPIEDLPVGRGYLVRMEDPSRCVSWLLRRLEEGARVVVEGRARSAAGARRVLLGAEATPHLVEWLDAHPQRWLHLDGAVWHLDPL